MFWLYVYHLSAKLMYFDIILLIVICFYSPEGKASFQSPVDIAKREKNIPRQRYCFTSFQGNSLKNVTFFRYHQCFSQNHTKLTSSWPMMHGVLRWNVEENGRNTSWWRSLHGKRIPCLELALAANELLFLSLSWGQRMTI